MSHVQKTVGPKEWDENFRGWRCPETKAHLLIEVRVEGKAASLEDFQQRSDIGQVIWRGTGPRPDQVHLVLAASSEKSETRLKLLAVALPLITALAAGSTSPWWMAYFRDTKPSTTQDPPPTTANLTTTVSVPPPTASASASTSSTPSVPPSSSQTSSPVASSSRSNTPVRTGPGNLTNPLTTILPPFQQPGGAKK